MRSRVLVAGAVLLLGAACSSTTQDGVEAGAEAPTEQTSAASGSESPSEAPTSSVEPATGPELVASDFDVAVLRFRLPRGKWEITGEGRSATRFTAEGPTDIGASATTGGFVDGLGFYAKGELEIRAGDERDPKRVDDRVVQGEEGFVLEGSNEAGLLYVFGTIYDESFVVVSFEFPEDTPEARDDIESVLASAEWL